MATNKQSKSMESVFCGHFISAPGRSSGKSLVSMGLARYACRQGTKVQTFKKGPDYIDPLWLKAASANSCYNLDPYTQSTAELRTVYEKYPAELVLVEGTMGLHDGLATDGSDCNAAIAELLGLPVLLVIDCRGMHRTIAALVNGLTAFDPEVNFSGVILNRVRTARHGDKIEQAISQYCDVPLLGKMPENRKLQIEEQELGLVSAMDHPGINQYMDRVADVLEASCDLHTLIQPQLVRPKTVQPMTTGTLVHSECVPSVRVGLARDEAFHFYYEDDLRELRSRGVELVEFSPLRDRLPEDLDGLLLGGGFPERHLQVLTENEACRQALAAAIAEGLPVRAECGGLMYLCHSIVTGAATERKSWPMVGAVKGIAHMCAKPQGRGYMQLKINPGLQDSLLVSLQAGESALSMQPLRAHEFHHSSITFDSEPDCLYEVTRGFGLDGQRDGVCVKNVVASFAHLRHTASTPWVDWFLDTIEQASYNVKQPLTGGSTCKTAEAVSHV